MALPHRGCGEACVNPLQCITRQRAVGFVFLEITSSHAYAPFLSSPMRIRVSARYTCGGTSRLVGAGFALKTRPAKSNVEPWQGHKKPPSQSPVIPSSAPFLNFWLGEQPRWVQIPTTTKISGLIDRVSFFA